MRVIEAFPIPIRSVAVSPDGRFLAAAGLFEIGLFDWITGTRLIQIAPPGDARQLAFTADGNWLVFATVRGLFRMATGDTSGPLALSQAPFSGGVAVAPDGRVLAATRADRPQIGRAQ